MCFPLCILLHIHVVLNVLLQTIYVWPRKSFRLHLLQELEKQNRPIVRFTYLCHTIFKESVFLSFLYNKLFVLGVEVTSATCSQLPGSAQIPTSEQLLRAHG